MNKWFRDVVLIPLGITAVGGFIFMIWGAWYTGVKLHSPFSAQWGGMALSASIPAWIFIVLSFVVLTAASGWYFCYKQLANLVTSSSAMVQVDAEVLNHDRSVFKLADEILNEAHLRQVLDDLQDDNSFMLTLFRKLDEYCRFLSQETNQFLSHELQERYRSMCNDFVKLSNFLVQHFFIWPERQNNAEDLRLCLYPDLNVDRNGSGTPETMNRYSGYQEELNLLVDAARGSYSAFRKDIKQLLYL